jgi:quercetin dioxygenase-like cupin family protein
MILRDAAARAVFSADKMGKVTLGAGERLFAGLNCFEPGQSHQAHVHPDQDKLYVILAGAGEAEVGEERSAVSVGDVILAPAGVPHGLANPGPGRLTALVVFAPPPR